MPEAARGYQHPSLPGALAGVRVIEFAQAMAIPMCAQVLADMGADVVKVEPPGGDAFRANQGQFVPGESRGFIVLNRGKRSICLDLGHPDARQVIEPLVRGSDIVLTSLKPPDLPRYGLTYGHLSAMNPRVIHLEHIPLGGKGPLGNDGGYDVVVQGISGTGSITARSRDGSPVNVRPAYMDNATGFLSALAVVAALRHRDQTGEGQRVETSLLLTALALGNNIINWFGAVDPPLWERFAAELGNLRAAGAGFEDQRLLFERSILAGSHGNIYFRHYRTKDGFISIGCLSPALNARFRAVTGIVDPRIGEPAFDHATAEGWDALTRLVRTAEDLLATRTTADWMTSFRAGGVPCGPFNFLHEVFEDPQILANDFLLELEHPAVGPYKTFAPPIRMDRTPTAVRRPSPGLGEHTDEILTEIGFTAATIASLRARGTVGRAPGS
jgi:formyl-CoA transferase